MFRHKTRDNFVDSYNLPNTIVNGVPETYTTIPNAKFMFTGADTVNAKALQLLIPAFTLLLKMCRVLTLW
jgi:hypothetical protein